MIAFNVSNDLTATVDVTIDFYAGVMDFRVVNGMLVACESDGRLFGKKTVL